MTKCLFDEVASMSHHEEDYVEDNTSKSTDDDASATVDEKQATTTPLVSKNYLLGKRFVLSISLLWIHSFAFLKDSSVSCWWTCCGLVRRCWYRFFLFFLSLDLFFFCHREWDDSSFVDADADAGFLKSKSSPGVASTSLSLRPTSPRHSLASTSSVSSYSETGSSMCKFTLNVYRWRLPHLILSNLSSYLISSLISHLVLLSERYHSGAHRFESVERQVSALFFSSYKTSQSSSCHLIISNRVTGRDPLSKDRREQDYADWWPHRQQRKYRLPPSSIIHQTTTYLPSSLLFLLPLASSFFSFTTLIIHYSFIDQLYLIMIRWIDDEVVAVMTMNSEWMNDGMMTSDTMIKTTQTNQQRSRCSTRPIINKRTEVKEEKKQFRWRRDASSSSLQSSASSGSSLTTSTTNRSIWRR